MKEENLVRNYPVEGMTCQNCKASVEAKTLQIPGVIAAKVDLDSGLLEVESKRLLTKSEIQNHLPAKYRVSDSTDSATPPTGLPEEARSKWQRLRPLFLILFYILAASVLLHLDPLSWRAMMLDFMGLFFIVFSFFKILDLKGFPDSFRMYDPLAKVLPGYAKIYPFMETVLGLMFLMRFQTQIALLVTVFILGATTIGVAQSLMDKRSIRCACLGTALNLPMTEATLVENALMLSMAGMLLLV